MTSAKDILYIEEVSEIQMRVEDLLETQEECIQLLIEELEQNTIRAAYYKKIKASNNYIDWNSCEQSPSREITDKEIEFFIQVGPSEESICPVEVDWTFETGDWDLAWA